MTDTLKCVGGPKDDRDLDLEENVEVLPVADRRGVALGKYVRAMAGRRQLGLFWEPAAPTVIYGVQWAPGRTYEFPAERCVADQENALVVRRVDNDGDVSALSLVWPAHLVGGAPQARSVMLIVEVPTEEIESKHLELLRAPIASGGPDAVG